MLGLLFAHSQLFSIRHREVTYDIGGNRLCYLRAIAAALNLGSPGAAGDQQ
jgi:hypothetical protein